MLAKGCAKTFEKPNHLEIRRRKIEEACLRATRTACFDLHLSAIAVFSNLQKKHTMGESHQFKLDKRCRSQSTLKKHFPRSYTKYQGNGNCCLEPYAQSDVTNICRLYIPPQSSLSHHWHCFHRFMICVPATIDTLTEKILFM